MNINELQAMWKLTTVYPSAILALDRVLAERNREFPSFSFFSVDFSFLGVA